MIKTESKVYGYVRVSTKLQLKNNSIEEQTKRILSKYPDAIIYEECKSGIELSDMILDIIDLMKEGDTFVVTKVDRLSRNVIYGLTYFDEIINIGGHFEVMECGEIDDSAYKRLMLTNLLAVAEFERTTTNDKMMRAREIARTKPNYKEGRPKRYSVDELNKACDMLRYKSYSRVACETGISVSTLSREKRRRRHEEVEVINEIDIIENYDF